MSKDVKIVVSIGKTFHVFNERRYNILLDSNADFKLIGIVNESPMNRLNEKQKEKLKALVEKNVLYLANKSPEQLIKNFKDSVLKEI